MKQLDLRCSFWLISFGIGWYRTTIPLPLRVLVLRRALALLYLHFLGLYHFLRFLVFGPLPVWLVLVLGILAFTCSVVVQHV